MRRLLHCSILLLAVLASNLSAEPARVLPAGETLDDARLAKLKDLNGYFPFKPCKTPQAWLQRCRLLRRQLRVAMGLWPMPTRTPANPVIHGKVDRDEYTVERVYLESFPGHFVTGSLYRPKGRSGAGPGVLCPHGHWANGRFYDAGEKKVKQEIAAGAERFEVGGRYPIQARCVQLARMGCTVFHWDMVGYADSQQLPHGSSPRDDMNGPNDWGYGSPPAEARLQNPMGLQTYNSIRVLDWFSGLPEVDPKRIGVTGASGGGTQTFILCAVDTRPAAVFPAVMVSTAMQGGCTCENAPYLRIGTGNVEIAALASPRPLAMTAARDWTQEMLTKGLPELKEHYRMLGVEDLVAVEAFLQFPHNYNSVSRHVMYHWFNKHLGLGQKEPIVERDYRPLSKEEMTVWDDAHPRPPGGKDYERSLLKWISADSQRQLAALVPKDRAGLEKYREVLGGAFDVLIGRRLPPPGAIKCVSRKQEDRGDWRLSKLLLRWTVEGAEPPDGLLAAVHLEPKKEHVKRVVIWIDKLGKQGLFAADGRPKPAVARLLGAGVDVLGVDLLGQGEFTTDAKPLAKAPMNLGAKNRWAGKACYTYGYNYPLFAKRVHDILSLIAFARDMSPGPERIDLVGLDGSGHWVAAAGAQAGAAVGRAVVDTAGFRFAGLTAIDDVDFLPGGAKYLDLPGLLALSAPRPMLLAGEGGSPPPVVAAAYKAAGKPENLVVEERPSDEAAVDWLMKK